MSKLLIESLAWCPAIVEGKNGGTNLRFKFMTAEEKNKNGRRYPEKVLSHAVSAAQAKIDAGESLYGSLGHLKEFQVSDISHRLLSLSMSGRDAICEAAVLGTTKGKDLLEVIRSGGSLGVSARGSGNVVNESGVDIVQSDYQLHGCDFVLDPSFDCRVGSANIYESAELDGKARPVDDPQRLWENAVRFKNFKGSLDEFILSQVDGSALVSFFHEALQAGFKGTFSEFKKSYISNRRKS